MTNDITLLFIPEMLKLISNLFLLFPIVVLTSCVEGDEEVWINDDASGNIVATYRLPTIALRQIGDPDEFIKALKLIDEKEVMIEITDLSFELKSGRAIFHLEAKFEDARELLSITERNKPVFSKQTKTDQKYLDSILGDINFRFDGITPAFDRLVIPSKIFPSMVKKRPKMLGSAAFRYCIHMPRKIKRTNAHIISDDRKTVTWIFKLKNHFEEPISMNLKAELPYWNCSIIILIVTSALWLTLKRKGRQRH
ncbi:hypothetical protein OAL53_02770 [Akkermansiaceae bacterium]|nr:hypothetical protein [Akkermansiaceae bacterium]MDB4660779.1 hypothetical protein [bacterium]MDA7655267.1 hypothetical protein [Akkermansiaceae bacterium]MDA7663266.1 hypothetical protein [Akkermansiaceae bacterium]MDA7683364.1 hypothetical protein [Akkermansiaceae bacterium]